MKKLYEFVVSKEEEIVVQEPSTNERGEEITISKKVKEKIPHTFFIRKPNRTLSDEADLYFGVAVSEGVKAGLLTVTQLWKRFLNDGGVLSEPEKQSLTKLQERLVTLQRDFQTLTIKSDRTPEETEKLDKVLAEIGDIRGELQKFEMQQSALFDQTAETRARNKIIFWYALNLAYKVDKDGKETPFFKGETLEDKFNHYDSIEESDDEFSKKLIKKFLYLTGFWYMGRANSQEDFQEVDKISDNLE